MLSNSEIPGKGTKPADERLVDLVDVFSHDIKECYHFDTNEPLEKRIDALQNNFITQINQYAYERGRGCIPEIYYNRRDLLSPDEYAAYRAVEVNLAQAFGKVQEKVGG